MQNDLAPPMSIQQYLAIGPIVFYGVTLVVIGFTVAYARRMISRVTAMRHQDEERDEASTGMQA